MCGSIGILKGRLKMQEFIEKLKILSKDYNVVPLICDEELLTMLYRKQLENDEACLGGIGTSRVLINNIDHCITIC